MDTAATAAGLATWARARSDWFGARIGEIAIGGRGESFVVWRLATSAGDFAVHLPVRAPVAQRVPALVAALRAAPAGVGPRVIGRDATGRYVTTWAAGDVRPPAAWGDAELTGLARVLARLHQVPAPDVATDDVSTGSTGSTDLAEAFDAALAFWRDESPAAMDTTAERLAAVLRERLTAIEVAAPGPTTLALCHGDPIAGNVVWPPGAGAPVLIDWEWARYGDPARDLGLIGGDVAADPWYAALSPESVRRFVSSYLEAGGRGELDALIKRRNGWLLLTTFTDTLYLRSLEAAGTATAANRASHRQLARGLAAELLA